MAHPCSVPGTGMTDMGCAMPPVPGKVTVTDANRNRTGLCGKEITDYSALSAVPLTRS